MKKAVFFSLVLGFMIAGCTQKSTKSPVEGAWKLVGVTSVRGDTVRNIKGAELGEQIKMWTGNYFSFTGTAKNGNTDVDLFGCGTYVLNGTDYMESITFHNEKSLVNTKYKATIGIKNDTLYQTYYLLDAAGKEMKNHSSTEKYIKLQ